MGSELNKFDSKEDFLAAFNTIYAQEYLPEEWDDETKGRVQEITKPSRTKTSIFSSIPMKCRAKKCEFADTCPLMKEHIAPEGKPCPLEMAMVAQFTADYMEQLDIDQENLVEVSLIRNLVDYEVQYVRTSKFLAKESFIQENVVGVDSAGAPVFQKGLHPAVAMQDTLQKRQKEVLKQLMATRDQKAKMGIATLDTAQAMANLMDQARQLNAVKDQIKLEKAGLANYDKYIVDAEEVDPEEY